MKTLTEMNINFKPKFYVVVVKEDTYENSNDPYLYDSNEFTSKKDAYKFYNDKLKFITESEADQRTEFKEIELIAYDEDHYNMEVIEEETHVFNYSEHYGKLVIDFEHTGKGMNYSHKFIGLWFLNNENEHNLSTNEDKRFRRWSYILELTKDSFKGLNYEEAVNVIKNEVNLKLENTIFLDDIVNEIQLKENFDFEIGEVIEIDQCYLDDEVTMNSKGISSRATIQSIPKDEEELVCIQYTSGLIDYVPQNIINKL